VAEIRTTSAGSVNLSSLPNNSCSLRAGDTQKNDFTNPLPALA